jgi:hypothetical protein
MEAHRPVERLQEILLDARVSGVTQTDDEDGAETVAWDNWPNWNNQI